MKNRISRRQFLNYGAIASASGAVALGFLGCSRALTQHVPGFSNPSSRFYSTPNRLIDLPEGFICRAISRTGEKMDDGFWVPGKHDGMAAFPGPNGKTILVRNHELNWFHKGMGAFGWNNERINYVDPEKFYDPGHGVRPALGGTTTLVYDTRTGTLDTHFLSLAGTLRNCAGGPTPWNTWITCEETVQKAEKEFQRDHGYNFEVPVSATPRLETPIPLKAMGRFNHEAIAVDARSGVVYQTEDRSNGLIYRFVPKEPGKLVAGGRLQAMKIRGMNGADTRNWKSLTEKILPWTYETIPVRQAMDVEWVDIENIESPKDDLRKQGVDEKRAAKFARGEGMWYSGNAIYFACTNGGIRKKGQIWRYTPSPFEGTSREEKQPGKLELFIEPNESNLLENADNLTVTPWGDLIICEDGPKEQYLVGVTPEGKLYRFARNAMNMSEFAGSTFSPDGTTLFVNIQNHGITLAITGPWGHFRQHGTDV